MLNPITQNLRYLAGYFSIWLVLSLIQSAVFYFLVPQELITSIVDAVVFNLLLGVVGIAIWPLVSFSSLDKAQLLNTLITHVVGAAILIALCITVTWKILEFIFADKALYLTFLKDSLLWRAALATIIYLLIALNYYVLIYNQEFKMRKVNESDLKRLLKDAELDMLKLQLNPHFIFNSLNSISSLTLTNPEKAQEMVISLSEFLRYSIKPNKDKLIPLRNELDAIKRFVEIEKVRFGERLQVEIKCSNECKNKLLPPLIIQPLVENAIKYGVHETIENSSISIYCSCTNTILEVIVKNNFDPKGIPSVKTGIGLKNVSNRLDLLYGSKGLLQIDKQNATFIIKLFIPQSSEI